MLLGFSIASILNFILLWLALHIEIGNLDELRILSSTIKFSAAAVLAGVAVQSVKLLVWPYIDMTRTWGVFTQGFLAGLSGILIYAIICSLLRSEEFIAIWTPIKCRLCRPLWKKVETGDQGEARGI